MSDADPDLATWEQGERRRNLMTGALAALVMVMAVAVVVLIVIVLNLSTILHRRSPVIARIDAAEAETECVIALQNRFLAAVGEGITSDEPNPDVVVRVKDTTEALRQIVEDGVEPCSLIPAADLEDLP